MLTAERVLRVNRIKGLLFCQGISGYEPLRRDRHERLEELQTGDDRPFPQHLKAQVNREIDRLELLLKQIKAVEAERDALLVAAHTPAALPASMLLNIKLKALVRSSPPYFGRKGSSDTSTTDARSPLMRA